MALRSGHWMDGVLGISWACWVLRLSLEKRDRAQTPGSISADCGGVCMGVKLEVELFEGVILSS